jgi:hypothetical protein
MADLLKWLRDRAVELQRHSASKRSSFEFVLATMHRPGERRRFSIIFFIFITAADRS